jgi:ubiquitin-conjugating enzyme E2 A
MTDKQNKVKRRLLNEIARLAKDPIDGITAAPVSDDDILLWNATIIGPPDSVFQGGVFPMEVKFHNEYPEKPPKIRFLCKMFHPNVYGNGDICVDILNTGWSPAFTIGTLLLSIRSLLTDPNPSSPTNMEAATLWQNEKERYKEKVVALMRREGCI